MAWKRGAVSYQEESALRSLSVKIIGATHIPWADWMSNADCYVCVLFPTCTNKVLKTKTVSNTSDPIWNETFQFTICSYVKNMLLLELHDEDVVSGNDLLYTVAFDVDKIQIGETKQETFTLNPNGPETLQVEFTVQELPTNRERVLTNGVVVSREMSCLEVAVDKQRIPKNVQGQHLVLSVEDSCEKTHRVELKPTTGPDSVHSCRFHCIKNWDPELTANLENGDDAVQIIPIKLLPSGKEQKIHLSTVQVYANCCGSRCFLPLRWIQPGESTALRLSQAERITSCWSPLNILKSRRLFRRHKARPLEVKLKAKNCTDQLNVRLGFDLCDDEKLYLSQRRKLVASTLKKVLKLDRDLEDHEIPVIAVTTTGGGVRAMTSLYGTLSGLKKLNLLDCVSYITGASGSTWAISKLYEDPNWSQKDLAEPIEDARRNVAKTKTSALTFDRLAFYREELRKRAGMGYKTSFTDMWGLLIESMFHDKVNDTKLTDQRKALSHGQNPLPLCLAMNVKSVEKSTLDYKEWCEFSPYEVGLLKYGAFIRSEDFGSEFFMGRRTKTLPESRICYLQGLWSNIFSVNLMDAWFAAVSTEHLWHRFTRDYVHEIDEEEALLSRRTATSGLGTRLLQPAGGFSRAVREILTNRPIDGEHHNFLRGLQMHADYSLQEEFSAFDELHNYPNMLTPSTEELCLVDSAYYINASFPPLLREERKVDLILSFDYGLSNKFTSVERTHSYCADHKLAFPKIEVCEEDRQNPKECHVFSDSENCDVPIILHFPLVNDTFTQFSHPGVERRTELEKEEGIVDLSGIWSPYRLLKLTYSKEDFNKLINLTEYNVENNEEMILQALRDAISQKQKLRTSDNI